MYTITFNSHSFPLSNYHFQSAVISPWSMLLFTLSETFFLLCFFSFRDIRWIEIHVAVKVQKWISSKMVRYLKQNFLYSNMFEKMSHLSPHIWYPWNLNFIEGHKLGATWTNVYLPLSLTLKSSTPITFVQGKTKNNVHV